MSRRLQSHRRRSRLARLKSVAILPTLLTLGNVLCGFAAIFYAARPMNTPIPWQWTPVEVAAWLIFLGMAFDALDGRVARMTKQTSELGAQLDSLADMVTFGVAPAFMITQQISGVHELGLPFIGHAGDTVFSRLVVVIAGLYVVCCALRLARFNVETTDVSESAHLYFNGLPSPGAAGTVASMILLVGMLLRNQKVPNWTLNGLAIAMVMLTLLVAFAMVSNLRYIHVMNRFMRGRAKFDLLVKIVVVFILLIISLRGAMVGGFVIYALSAPTMALWRRTRRNMTDRITDKQPETETHANSQEPV